MDQKIAQHVAKLLLDSQSIMINTKEPFTYTSGKIGPTYCDMRRLISLPTERKIIMDYSAELIKPLGVDYLAGGETAGIPYAAFLAERTDLPMLYVRKKPKGHGRMAQIEGHMEGDNANVMLIEDLMTVGTSQKIFVDALRAVQAKIEHSFVIFSYDIYPQSKVNLREMGITCHALTNWWAVLDTVKSENYFDSETIASLEEFLNAPNEWEENFKKAS
jgi:orotate phosphoribosyltransferase